MKKKSNAKIVAMLTAFLMVFAMMPLVAFGEEVPDVENLSNGPAYVEMPGAEGSVGEDVDVEATDPAVVDEEESDADEEEFSLSAKGGDSEQLSKDYEEYSLWVGGTQVTTDNCDNIPAAKGYIKYSGKASYDADTNTLTLDNYVYEGRGSHSGAYICAIGADGLDSLTISLKGDNYIKHVGEGGSMNANCVGIGVKRLAIKDDSAQGIGSLTIDEVGLNQKAIAYGIEADGTVSITGGRIVVNGYEAGYHSAGVFSHGDVNIIGGSLTATAKATSEQDSSKGVSLLDGKLIIGKNAQEVTAIGQTEAISGRIQSAVYGKAWTTIDKTDDPDLIPPMTGGGGLESGKYKIVTFPTEAPEYPLVFDPGEGGSGSMNSQNIYILDTFTFPECTFDPPKGKTFDHWEMSGNDGIFYSGNTTDIAPNCVQNEVITVTAHWKEGAEPTPTPKPAAKISGTPLTTMKAGDMSMTIAWQKVTGAEGYDIFFSRCDGKGKTTAKKAQTINGNSTFTWTNSGLKAGVAYKAYVKAYVMKGGKKQYVASSPLMHAYTQGYTKRYTNAKSVKVNKTKVTVKKGKTFKIKAKVKKLKKGKKLMPKKHELKLRYLSTDTSIATVSKKGKIKGVKAGTCYVYAYAHNGVFKKIKVTVK